MDQPIYDTLGIGYRRQRQTDPRIAAQIHRALSGMQRVLNVGAGTGSYEPAAQEVIALEPSRQMIRQRPTGAAPVVQGVAEALPFRDGSFDAVLAVLTVHHWRDLGRGITEMRRVARERVAIFMTDPASVTDFWLLSDYFPAMGAAIKAKNPPVADVAGFLGGAMVDVVPVPADCVDGFLSAYWARPEAYLDPAVRRSISAFVLVDEQAVTDGLTRLRTDLESGVWHDRYQPPAGVDAVDLGYRLVWR